MNFPQNVAFSAKFFIKSLQYYANTIYDCVKRSVDMPMAMLIRPVCLLTVNVNSKSLESHDDRVSCLSMINQVIRLGWFTHLVCEQFRDRSLAAYCQYHS